MLLPIPPPIDSPLAVVIMAAGKGTRMNNPGMAKVMYTVDGKPMVEHVVDTALAAGADRVILIVGWQSNSVIAHMGAIGKGVLCVLQSPQLGTGHAVMQAERALAGFSGDVVVLSGDVPLLLPETVISLVRHHRKTGAVATVLTAIMDDPTGYGRVLRTPDGSVDAIVEQKDASPEQKGIREINSGIYVFRAAQLFEGLGRLRPDNAQKEYYLTDVIGHLRSGGLPVEALPVADAREVQGVNTPAQLEEIQELMRRRKS
jgi:UDP-N-acetylglucosamine diphosphorylase/glucosamine-1-phosphate N-acetyltransferase